LEKIKTIGDGYLAVSGVSGKTNSHAKKCVTASKKMIQFLSERNREHAIKWEIRIGIHSGPITAGVVGKDKFTYDIFGDTVNIASRIETAGKAGKINVSAYTYELIKDEFPGVYRGKINTKGKGDLDMYYLK
jgi:adenylate cyclase